MADFRYAQFCPLARATELLGERWTLLVLRELFLGPRRFADLRAALDGVSTSVLSRRLARLEERGVVRRRELPPPASASVYELSESGRALLPAVLELARWGFRFMGAPEAGQQWQPEWLGLGLATAARTDASPARAFGVEVAGTDLRWVVRGGRRGTSVRRAGPVDADVRADTALVFMGLARGDLDPEAALRGGLIRVEGELAALADFPRLFDFAPEAPDVHDFAAPPTKR